MEEKTFYKSRGHWFASKEEAEEWDKRIEAEEKEVYKYLLNGFPADISFVYSEEELDGLLEEVKGLGVTEKDLEKYDEGAPSKLLDDFFDKLPITQVRKSLEALTPSQFLRFIREIKFFEECFLDQRVTVIKDNYLIRGDSLNKKQDFFDWLKDHEINPPPDTLKQKERVEEAEETQAQNPIEKSNSSWLWKWSESDDLEKDDGNMRDSKSPL